MTFARTDLTTEELLLLWAARETGALDALVADADGPADVAETTGITPEAANLVVRTLTERGFLAEVDGTHEPTNRMLGFLASADLRSVGALPDALDAIDALVALPETMASGEPPESDDLTHRLGAREALDEATVRAVVTAAVREAPGAATVLDVRGAPGTFAREFAARGYDATLADHPDAVEAATPLLATTAVETAAVADDDPLPGNFDLVFAADVARRNGPDANCRLVERMADALAPDGTLVLVDFVRGRSDRAVPTAVEAFARDGGRAYREPEITEWFAAAGLADPKIRDVPGDERAVVVGRG